MDRLPFKTRAVRHAAKALPGFLAAAVSVYAMTADKAKGQSASSCVGSISNNSTVCAVTKLSTRDLNSIRGGHHVALPNAAPRTATIGVTLWDELKSPGRRTSGQKPPSRKLGTLSLGVNQPN